jgi:RNA polymerase sigma factor (sigma-70 family)
MEESSSPRTTWQVVEDLLTDPATRTKLATFARSCYGIEAPEADDLLQDTALELLHHEANVRKPEGYVFAVFKVKCLLHISRRAAARALFAGEDPPDRPGKDVDDWLLALREAFSEISLRCRRLISAYYLEGRSLKETAYDLSLSPASVFKLVSRCLGRLRRCLS